jgi:hypothetical protein
LDMKDEKPFYILKISREDMLQVRRGSWSNGTPGGCRMCGLLVCRSGCRQHRCRLRE